MTQPLISGSGAEQVSVTLALLDAGRLHEGGALGGEMLVIEARTSRSLEDAAIALVKACDSGGAASGALSGPAAARCWWATSDRFGLFISLRDSDPVLRGLWLRALARDAQLRGVPRAQFSVISCPRVPAEVQAEADDATARAARWRDIARFGHLPGRPRLAAGAPGRQQALKQAEAWRNRERRLKLQAAAPLLEALADAVPAQALPVGRPLNEVLVPEEHRLLFDLLGDAAAVDDLAGLSAATQARMGLEAAERKSLSLALRR